MNKIFKQIQEVENNISINEVKICDIALGINFFYLKGYDGISKHINDLFQTNKSLEKRKELLKYWKALVTSKRRVYRKIITNIKSNNCNIIISNNDRCNINEYIERDLKRYWNLYNDQKSISENCSDFLIAKLEFRVWELNNELLYIEKHPSVFYNIHTNYVGHNFRLKYNADIVKYKDTDIRTGPAHSYTLFANEDSTENTQRTLLNILAFFDCQPYYYMTDNASYNKKLSNLYEQFDILDIIKLRKENFLSDNIDEPYFLEKPILKSRGYLVSFEVLPYEEILDLYHSSLKQIEPLPRCVFLYRVFEYGASQHYKKIFKPDEYKPEIALEYYIQECLKYNYNPVFYNNHGSYVDYSTRTVIGKRKRQMKNFMITLKKETKEILKGWKEHKYLKNKKGPGDIIYNTGRNLVAHGANGKNNMKYDYDRNYKHINDINIVLELIARYLVEVLNPELKNRVERRKKYYSKE